MRCSAHVAVVHLNNARKCVVLVSLSHRTANSVQKIPRRLIADVQRTAQLNSGNAAFVRGTEIDRPEPDCQRQMRAVHNGSRGDGGLVLTGTALERVSSANRVVFRTAAFRAEKAVRKPKPE